MYDTLLYLTLFISVACFLVAGVFIEGSLGPADTVDRRSNRMAFLMCLFLACIFLVLYIDLLRAHYKLMAESRLTATLLRHPELAEGLTLRTIRKIGGTNDTPVEELSEEEEREGVIAMYRKRLFDK